MGLMTPPAVSTAFRGAALAHSGMGLGGVALAWLLQQEQLQAMPASVELRKPHNTARARVSRISHHGPKPMISLFQHGGPSHMDLTDPKPELTKYSGTDYPGDVQFSFVNEASKKLLGSPWKFRHGNAARSSPSCCRTPRALSTTSA